MEGSSEHDIGAAYFFEDNNRKSLEERVNDLISRENAEGNRVVSVDFRAVHIPKRLDRDFTYFATVIVG